MSRNIEDRADREMRVNHLRKKMTRLNKHLDNTEESIMEFMRLGGPPELSAEAIHCLIGERENTKYLLKELHEKIYS